MVGIRSGCRASIFNKGARKFFTAVVSQSGALTSTEKYAIDVLSRKMNRYDIWDKCKAVYPVVGSSAAAHSINLVNPGTYTVTWVNTPTHTSTGVDYNGSNEYGISGVIPNQISAGNVHMGVYLRQGTLEDGRFDFSMTDAADFNLTMYLGLSSGVSYLYLNGGSDTDASWNAGSVKGFWVGDKVENSGTVYRMFFSGSFLGTEDRTTTNRVNSSIGPYLGCRNSSGTPANYSNRECAFYTIGTSITASLQVNYYDIVQEFQTTLGREV